MIRPLLFTLFYVQDLTGVDLDLHFPVSVVFAEPTVAWKHVLHPMNWHRDLHAVQKPPSPQTLIGVTDQETVDLSVQWPWTNSNRVESKNCLNIFKK